MSEAAAAGRVVVVGGGAAGMVAAIAAARLGARVTILERMPRVGKKLLATGNGRCNLANARLAPGRFHGGRPGFPEAALERFGLPETLAFFRGLGIEPREEEGGKIFPRSGQAASVLDVLRHELARLGVESRCDSPVTALRRVRRAAWSVETAGGPVPAAAVVLASGGMAAPQLGADGSGYGLLRSLGHRIVEPFPALTRLRAPSPWLRHLKGVKIDGTVALESGPPEGSAPAGAAAWVPAARAAGEILFTETGLSGPPVLDVSRAAGEIIGSGRRCRAVVDLAPDLEGDRLAALLQERFADGRGASAEFALVGLLNRRLIAPLLKEAGVAAPGGPAAALPAARLAALAALIKGWRFEVAGTGPWREAQVTAGGVDANEVDPGTLASLRAPALFVAGEILDVDGDCGGFNLQWAWSSGHLAGVGAAETARAAGPP